MHILYLDESGTHSLARYFVVAGLAVFERETYFLARDLDQLQVKYFPNYEGRVTFHASSLRAQKGRIPEPFDQLTGEERKLLIDDIYQVIANSKTRLFAVAMEKSQVESGFYERGFEQILNRFDLMLGQFYRDGQPQRGLIVVAESSYRENIETLATKIATQGHRWGETYNQADIPYFAPAKSTRLLQLADFVTNAVFGRYESGYSRLFDRITPRFHQHEGRMHGLVHIVTDRSSCYCPACLGRRAYPRPETETTDDSQATLPL